ncbi:ead/Ea22-like family protein [Enterobacter asburiae]|uniref:ead/Ea22-like family protein n=1 Tax=Enterobacter asburiae TaxID=61645 RepID=UPI0021D387FD|nr:ead/Ea22-like family protein [Enterobacter asburiae]MCU6240766.1 ead/Ea22-like family protein [Enterobacter asburiae]
MSNIDKQALREAAQKATQGHWVETCGEVTTADYEVEGVTFLDLICNCEIVGTESPNAEFIAAANPATVLALLDELEDYKAAYEEYARDKEVQRLCKLLPGTQYMDPPDGVSVTPLEQVRRMVADYRERIAELEAREVNLPKHCVAEVMLLSGFDRQYAEGWCAGNDNAIHEIHSAGIKIAASSPKGE